MKLDTEKMFLKAEIFMLYDYLLRTYGKDEPIIISELLIENISSGNLRQQIKKLTDEGLIRRYDSGIYYIPKTDVFNLS